MAGLGATLGAAQEVGEAMEVGSRGTAGMAAPAPELGQRPQG